MQNKKAPRARCLSEFMVQHYFDEVFLANLLLRLAALFLWMMPRLASLSIMLITSGNLSVASLPVDALNSRIALRVVLP